MFRGGEGFQPLRFRFLLASEKTNYEKNRKDGGRCQDGFREQGTTLAIFFALLKFVEGMDAIVAADRRARIVRSQWPVFEPLNGILRFAAGTRQTRIIFDDGLGLTRS